MFVHTFEVDWTKPQTSKRLPEQLLTLDNGANRILCHVKSGGTDADLTGYTCLGYVQRNDGNTVTITGTVDGSDAYIDLPEAAYDYPGQIIVVVRVVKGNERTSLLHAVGIVSPSATGSAIDPGSVVPDLTTLLNKIAEMEAATVNANAAAINATESAEAYGAIIAELDGTVYTQYLRAEGIDETAGYYTITEGALAPMENASYKRWYGIELPAGTYTYVGLIPKYCVFEDTSVSPHTYANELGSGNLVSTPTTVTINHPFILYAATTSTNATWQWCNGDAVSDPKAEGVYDAELTRVDELDADVSDLKSAFNDISVPVKSKNLLDPDTAVVGRLASNGTIQTNMTAYFTSDYILLEAGKTYVLASESLTTPGSTGLMGYSGYGFYDLSKVWIADSRVYDNFGSIVLTITPETDCYIRVTGTRTYLDSDTSSRYILQEGSALDGYEAYFDPYYKPKGLQTEDIVQTSGQNTNKVMSQKAVTDYTAEYIAENVDLDSVAPYTIGKNKYNPDDCSPQNSVCYNTTGDVTAAFSYAITGKIPVEAGKTYTLSSTALATGYARPYFFSGESGETLISRSETTGVTTVVTPENCTFVAFNLFGRTHTAEDFEEAVAILMLEEGSTATTYEPYIRKRMVSTDSIEGGDQIAAITEVTEKISIVNLYDKSLAKDGKYYNRGVESSNADWAATGKIPVKPNQQYNLSVDPSAPMKLTSTIYTFDETGTYLGTATLGNYVYGTLLSFSTGPDVHFIAAHMNVPGHTAQDFQDTFDTVMLCYGTARPLQYSPYNPIAVTVAEKNTDEFFNPDVFAGKRWLATGTSITWYDSKVYQAGLHEGELCRGYVGNVARRKALLVTNEGISGSTLANVNSSSLINRYQDLDWANADIATIEYGVNDFGHAVDIGTADDAPGTDTFAACLKTVIEYALTQNPKLCLVICTEPDVRGNTQNTGGHYLKEYTDVTLEIAKQYRLPVCDWYYHCGINAVTKGNSSVDLLTADGTHPNDAGHLRMGAMLNQVFDSLIC